MEEDQMRADKGALMSRLMQTEQALRDRRFRSPARVVIPDPGINKSQVDRSTVLGSDGRELHVWSSKTA